AFAIVFIIITADNSKIMANTNEISSAPTQEQSQQNEENLKSEELPKSSQMVLQPEFKYLLTNFNGKLALFNFNIINNEFEKQPVEVYNVYIKSLPEYDASLLEQGIKIKTDSELESYLQDFTS
ncbi:MAG: hypothetical protein RR483_03370, partial [Clostridia bacterium]